MVNTERVLKEFFELVQVPCSTKNERQIADILKAKLSELGLDVQEDNTGEKIGGNAGNVFGFLKGNVAGPCLLLSAHMDCVEPCTGIKPQLKDGIITSDGTTILGSDDKSGVVAILEALRVVKEQNLEHSDIQVLFTVSEEGGVNGSKNMDKSLLKADFGYALDSSGTPGEIIVMAPGQYKITTVVKGRTAHAGLAPEAGLNAITLAAKAIAAVSQGRIDEETTANVGIISGGTATNVVPDSVKIISEARSRNPEKLEKQLKLMVDTFEQVVTENGGEVEIVTAKAYNPYVLKETDPVIETAKKAIEAIGLQAKTKATGGGSDANFINSYGVPCAVLATGMTKVHTKEEYIKEEHLYDTARVVVSLIKNVVK